MVGKQDYMATNGLGVGDYRRCCTVLKFLLHFKSNQCPFDLAGNVKSMTRARHLPFVFPTGVGWGRVLI